MLGEGGSKCALTCEGAHSPHGRPCAHGCHKILTNWRLAEAVAAREGLHALGYPHISERASPRGTRCAHRLVPKHGSQRRYDSERTFPGNFRENLGGFRGRLYRGYKCCGHITDHHQNSPSTNPPLRTSQTFIRAGETRLRVRSSSPSWWTGSGNCSI